jgi:lipoprotein-anchoring transpeptidase ErfK/SrfK
MIISRKILASFIVPMVAALSVGASAQIEVPRTAPTAGRDTSPEQPTAQEAPLILKANLGARILFVTRGDSTLKTYAVAVGQEKYPTPLGSFTIRKIVWNPSWKPPPDAEWAKGKTAKGPGDPGNPMKIVKIFFQEPDYYIHGTDDVESLGSAASHGCLRMDPSEVADLAKLIMDHGGQPRGENWFWRILHSRREETVVYLDNPVSLTIGD